MNMDIEAVRVLEQQVHQLRLSILDLLHKLHGERQLPWHEMMNSYLALSSQCNSLVEVMRKCNMELRDRLIVPTRLSLDADVQLQSATDGRVPSWNHALVPNYLRTRPEQRVLNTEKHLLEQNTGKASDKQLVQMSKLCDNASALLKEYTQVNRQYNTRNVEASNEDTRVLVNAMLHGNGLVDNQPSTNRNMAPPFIPPQA